jgi:hypothetical protein
MVPLMNGRFSFQDALPGFVVGLLLHFLNLTEKLKFARDWVKPFGAVDGVLPG